MKMYKNFQSCSPQLMSIHEANELSNVTLHENRTIKNVFEKFQPP